MIDREGIRKLQAFYGIGRLSYELGITAPTFRKFMKGKEPKHEAVSDFINKKVQDLLTTKPMPIVALEWYVDLFANHRLSIDEGQPGPDCKYLVLRYPIGKIKMLWTKTSNTLFIHKYHFMAVMAKKHPTINVFDELYNLEIIRGENKFNMLRGSGKTEGIPTVNLILDLADPKISKVLEIVQRSAMREEPDQDARVYP